MRPSVSSVSFVRRFIYSFRILSLRFIPSMARSIDLWEILILLKLSWVSICLLYFPLIILLGYLNSWGHDSSSRRRVILTVWLSFQNLIRNVLSNAVLVHSTHKTSASVLTWLYSFGENSEQWILFKTLCVPAVKFVSRRTWNVYLHNDSGENTCEIANYNWTISW